MLLTPISFENQPSGFALSSFNRALIQMDLQDHSNSSQDFHLFVFSQVCLLADAKHTGFTCALCLQYCTVAWHYVFYLLVFGLSAK